MGKNKRRKRRYNIGLLVSNVMDSFSNEIAKGAMLAAERLDVNLFLFPARYVDHDSSGWVDEQFEYQYNALLSYAASGKLDFIVACVGTIMYSSNSKRKKELIDMYKGTPVLCVCTNVDDCNNIQYDNYTGIIDAIDYLVKAGRKHICMMIGDEGNYECRQRYESYRNALEKNGLPYSTDMVMHSDLSIYCDREVEELLARNPQVDAILCAADVLAITVCKVLKEQHKKIGDDIAVIGYDDMPYAAKMNPPLASINADAFKLGFYSIEKAVADLEGEPNKKELLHTTFIPRESCMRAEDYELDKKSIFCGTCEKVADNIMGYVYGENKISDEIIEMKKFWEKFISLVKERIVKGEAKEEEVNHICRLLELYLVNNQYRDDVLLKIVDVFEFACAWISAETDDRKKVEAIESIRRMAYRKLMGGLIADLDEESNREYQYMHNTNLVMRETLMLGRGRKESYADILSKLSYLNIKSSYLYLLDKPTLYCEKDFFPIDVKWNFEAYQDGMNTFVVEKCNINANELYCNSYMDDQKRHTYIAVDLFSREYQYGMLLCEIETDEFFKSLEFVAYQVSAAIKIVDLLSRQETMLAELHTRNLALEQESKIDELTGVYNRRGFYSVANEMIAKEENAGRRLIVCYADMDNLKKVNDSFGHMEGDFSLKVLANCLVEIFGENGIVGRMGGDEFAAIVFKDLAEDGAHVVERKEEMICQLNATVSKPYRIDMSMGFFEGVCNNSYDLKAAMDKADDMLYTVKMKRKGGR